MPFGLRNAAGMFRVFIDEVRGLDFAFAHIDNLIACSILDQHYHHVTEPFKRLRSYHAKINPNANLVPQLRILGTSY